MRRAAERKRGRRIIDLAHLDIFLTWQHMKAPDEGLSLTETMAMPAAMLHDFRVFFGIMADARREIKAVKRSRQATSKRRRRRP